MLIVASFTPPESLQETIEQAKNPIPTEGVWGSATGGVDSCYMPSDT